MAKSSLFYSRLGRPYVYVKKNQKIKIHNSFFQDVFSLLNQKHHFVLTEKDISRLICDWGRNEINSRMATCIEDLSQWKSVLLQMEKEFCIGAPFEKKTLFSLEKESLNISSTHIECYLEIKKRICLNQNCIQVLKMIVHFQNINRFKK